MNKKLFFLMSTCAITYAVHAANKQESSSYKQQLRDLVGSENAELIKKCTQIAIGPVTTLDDIGTHYGPKTATLCKNVKNTSLTQAGNVLTTIKNKAQEYPGSTGVAAGAIVTGTLVKLTTAQPVVLPTVVNNVVNSGANIGAASPVVLPTVVNNFVNSCAEIGAAGVRQLITETTTRDGYIWAGGKWIKNSIYRIDLVNQVNQVNGIVGTIKRHPILSVVGAIAANQALKRYFFRQEAEKTN